MILIKNKNKKINKIKNYLKVVKINNFNYKIFFVKNELKF